DKPRPSVASAADHQPVGTGFAQRAIGVVESDDIAVRDHRNEYSLLNLPDEFPIGGTGIELAARAAMHADHADAASFGDPRQPRPVPAATVPAGTHLQSHRQVYRPDRGLEDARGVAFIPHQRRAGMTVDHLFYRAAKIDVDDARPAIGVELCRLRHYPRLA